MPRLREKSLVKANLELWLNNQFLRDGFYQTVTVGETNIYGENISQLIPVEDESWPDNAVWQSPFKEWVYESGISPTWSGVAPPVIASGVTVNGTFYPRHSYMPGYSGVYAHNIDYRNGRILFATPLLSTDVVSATFSYKTIGVDFADTFESEENNLIIETSYKDNPSQSGTVTYPDRDSKTLPMVFIDLHERTSEGYELGWKSLIASFAGTFHIWTRDSHTKDLVEDLLAEKQRDIILGIDFNTCPFPLDHLNDKNSAYTSWDSYQSMWNQYFWHRIYLDTASAKTDPKLKNIQRSRIDFRVVVYPTQ